MRTIALLLIAAGLVCISVPIYRDDPMPEMGTTVPTAGTGKRELIWCIKRAQMQGIGQHCGRTSVLIAVAAVLISGCSSSLRAPPSLCNLIAHSDVEQIQEGASADGRKIELHERKIQWAYDCGPI